MRNLILLSAAAVAASIFMTIPTAQANGYRAKDVSVEVAKSPMKVTPKRDWNSLSLRPGKKAETWTLDGEQLNDVTFYGGVAPGEALIREESKKHKPLPKFTRETLLVEVPELLEGTYRTEKGIGSFAITSSSPDRFLGHYGIRFTYEFVDADSLPRKGEARAILIKGLLYMATFDAPRLHYFDAALADFRDLTDSAVM